MIRRLPARLARLALSSWRSWRHSSGESHNESFASYSWIVRGRLGLEPMLRAELERNRPPSLRAALSSEDVDRPGVLEAPEGVEAEGAVEILGSWDVLYWTLGCRLAQSVWVRVGEPRECDLLEDLEEAVERAPWDHFLDGRQPIRSLAWERESRLNAEDVEATLARVLRRPTATGRPATLRAVLHQNRCSLELLCAARLGLREVQRAHVRQARLPPESTRPPTWTLASAVKQGPAEPVELLTVKAESQEAKTVDGTFAAALVAQVRLSDGMLLWDPFCRDGQVLLELLSATLPVPPILNAEKLPCAKLRPHRPRAVTSAERSLAGLRLVGSDRSSTAIQEARKRLLQFCDFYKDHLPAQSAMPARSMLEDAAKEASEPVLPKLLQGPVILDDQSQDTSRAPKPQKGRRAKGKGAKMMKVAAEISEVSSVTEPTRKSIKMPDVLTSEDAVTFSSTEHGLSLPSEVSLNVASFETIAPYLRGAVIVTRMPSEGRGLGPTARMTLLYRRFGHFLAARRDFLGAYVLCDSRVFRRQSGLAWQVLSRFRGASGRRWQLLHWSPGLPVRTKGSIASAASGQSWGNEEEPRRRRQRWERAPRRGQRRPRFRHDHDHNT